MTEYEFFSGVPEIAPNMVCLIDDDEDNVATAIEGGLVGVHFDIENPGLCIQAEFC